MLWLGILRDRPNGITFRLSSNEPLAPATVTLTVTDHADFSEEISMSRGDDDSHYNGLWDTLGRALGVAHAVASAEDLSGNLATVEGDLEVISSYGRHYGQQYGNGL